MSSIYVLKAPVVKPNWGDYSDLLRHGMSEHRGRNKGFIQLERTGPYIPAVTFPGAAVVVTDDIRRKLTALVPTLDFREVIKAHIADVNWHEWDFDSDEPLFYPSTGEPEDYVLERPHDKTLADKMGALWELLPAVVKDIQGESGSIRLSKYDGQDIVGVGLDDGHRFISPRLRNALQMIAPDAVLIEVPRLSVE